MLKQVMLIGVILILSNLSFSQTSLDKRVIFLMDSLDLDEKNLMKLELIRTSKGFESKAWNKMYQKWDADDQIRKTNVIAEVLSRNSHDSGYGSDYSGYSSAYVMEVLKLREKNMSPLSKAFLNNSLHKQSFLFEDEIENDLQLLSGWSNTGRIGTARFNEFQEACNLLFQVHQEWRDKPFSEIYHLSRSMSRNEWELLIDKFAESDLSLTMLNADIPSRLKEKTDLGRRFGEMLDQKYNCLYQNSSFSCLQSTLTDLDFLRFDRFMKNDSIRVLLIGLQLFQDYKKEFLSRFDNSDNGSYLWAIMDALPSEWMMEAERSMLHEFRKFVPHDNYGNTEFRQFILSMQNGVYLIPDYPGSKELGILEKMQIERIKWTDIEEKFIQELKENGKLSAESLILLEDDGVYKDLNNNLIFRFMCYMMSIRHVFQKNADYFGNVYHRSISSFNQFHQIDPVLSPQLISDRKRITSNLLKSIVDLKFSDEKLKLITDAEGNYRLIGDRGQIDSTLLKQTLLKQTILGLGLANFIRDDGIDYFRFVFDFSDSVGFEKPIPRVYSTRRALKNDDSNNSAPQPPVRAYPVPPPPLSSQDPVVIVVKSPVIEFPDRDASFPGGAVAMKKWIDENLQYPEISKELGDQGRVYVTFVVEVDGSISGIDVLRSVTSELDREAKRLIRSMPKWIPGEVRGDKARCRCRVPITFTL